LLLLLLLLENKAVPAARLRLSCSLNASRLPLAAHPGAVPGGRAGPSCHPGNWSMWTIPRCARGSPW
jgi:hypothetical protein